jgi:nucleotide-binding universal stress UspA family protein
MKKILVTTDFSANSKAALCFAIQIASQCEVALTFLHVQHVMRMTSWSEDTYAAYQKGEITKAQMTLNQFVESIYNELNISPTNYTCVIQNSPFVDSTIMRYAADHAFDFICISTRGAGTLEKLIGTTTANLINQSSVPVIAVPGTYRATKLTSILYASDLSSLEPQLRRVVDFARPLDATVELLHLSTSLDPVTDPEIINMAIRKFADYPINVHLQPRDFAMTLVADIELTLKKTKPSMMIMFTKQNEGFFSRLFLSSNSVDYSFLTTVPLLVFSKA